MTPERFQQIERLVSLAQERQPLERARFLDEACAGDEQLRERVEALLRAHEQLGDFLAQPPPEIIAEVLAAEESQTAEPTLNAGHLGDVCAPTSAAPSSRRSLGTLTSGATLASKEGATLPSVDVPEGLLKPGSPLGRYVVRERLGAGGMGVVYEAYDPELNRKIAIKLMRPAASGNTAASPGRARLMREAQAMAQLAHPNVIAVYDVGTFGNQV